ncbi:hypothetical protein M3193_03575 [Sporosarcina luteola]|uniref:hypothetical protein n=1 Tax=Sporosarcina luteola TaxID=582850 RepID=UPI0020415F2E|nr:hypothetical protein [Sporosarcina luteola]MCM3743213.1 hypothetical protein [Sporosarcina luteola]
MSFAGYQSLMNDTKWEEIWLAMIDIPELIYWRQKDIETNYICEWDANGFIISKQMEIRKAIKQLNGWKLNLKVKK